MIFAADHGVSAEGISAYGEEVTDVMAVNMLMGGAVSSVLARKQGIKLQVVDVGVRTRVRHPEVIERKVRLGTANLAAEPVMTRPEAVHAVHIGMEIAEGLLSAGHDLLAVGERTILPKQNGRRSTKRLRLAATSEAFYQMKFRMKCLHAL